MQEEGPKVASGPLWRVSAPQMLLWLPFCFTQRLTITFFYESGAATNRFDSYHQDGQLCSSSVEPREQSLTVSGGCERLQQPQLPGHQKHLIHICRIQQSEALLHVHSGGVIIQHLLSTWRAVYCYIHDLLWVSDLQILLFQLFSMNGRMIRTIKQNHLNHPDILLS